jgi:NAD-dependent deacetylase
MAALDLLIEQSAQLIAQAHNVVAMTGAGISTPSGIPDFRSPTSGLWDQFDPFTVASIVSFRQNPRHF